jgi:lysozyme-like protein
VPRLTYAQMEGYWIRAGGPPAVAPVAAAIGEAESGGNTDALNPTDNNGRQSSFGVWQISNGTHQPPSPNWADPATNASLAVAKYKGAGNSFSPWGTFNTGAYRAYLNGSTTPDMNVQGNPDAKASETAAHTQSDCLWGIGLGGSILHDITGLGSGGNLICFVSRSQARGIIGALLLAGGVAGAALSLGFELYLAGRDNELGRLARRGGGSDPGVTEADFGPPPAGRRRAAAP